jgi:WD40 repeat protein
MIEPIFEIDLHSKEVNDIAVDGTGQFILSAGDDEVVAIFDPSGKTVQQLATGSKAICVVPVGPSPETVAVGLADGRILFWQREAVGFPEQLLAHDGPVTDIAFGTVSGMSSAVTCGTDGLIRVWDSETWDPLFDLQGHASGVRSVCMVKGSSGPDLLASVSKDRTLRLWDLEDRRQLSCSELHSHWIWAASTLSGITPDDIIVTAGLDGWVCMVDRDGKSMGRLEGYGNRVLAVTPFEYDGSPMLATGLADGVLHVWDPVRLNLLGSVRAHSDEINAIALLETPDGEPALWTCGRDALIRAWRLSEIVPQDSRAEVRVQWFGDRPSLVDELGRTPLAKFVATQILSASSEEKTFALLLDAPWGAGKSSFLELIRQESIGIEPTTLSVELDAWKERDQGPAWFQLSRQLEDAMEARLRTRSRWAAFRFRSEARMEGLQLRYIIASSIVAIAAVLVGLSLLNWIIRSGFSVSATVLGTLGTGVGALAVLGSIPALVRRLSGWGSSYAAARYEQTRSNPMRSIVRHFNWLCARADGHIVYLIENLDRCTPERVVDLLDAVQTIGQLEPGNPCSGLSYVVAADSRWIRSAYESVHLTAASGMSGADSLV